MLRRAGFIGLRIATLRRRNNLSRAELAEELDCSPEEILRYERGFAVPPLDLILRASLLFGCSAEYFYAAEPKQGQAPDSSPDSHPR